MSDPMGSLIGSQPHGTRGKLPEVLVRPFPLLSNKHYNKYYYRGLEGFNQPGNMVKPAENSILTACFIPYQQQTAHTAEELELNGKATIKNSENVRVLLIREDPEPACSTTPPEASKMACDTKK